MTTYRKLAAAVCLLLAPTAFAAAPPNYAALMGGYVLEDKARAGDNGLDWQAVYGSPINNWLTLELNGFGTRLDRENQSVYDYQYGAGIDFVGTRPFGALLQGFVLGGIGSLYEDFPGTEEISPYGNVGAGILIGVPMVEGLKIRGEARYYAIFNGRTYPDKDMLFDGRLNVGLQYALGSLFEEPVIVGDADSDGDGIYDATDMCPGTPRGMMVDVNGCPSSADDDGDGVPNDRDACPGTPPGTLVDGRGCPATVPMLAPPSAMNPDEDGDGVLNERDACPHTPRGLRVDATGCAVKAQTIVILKSVNFEFDKATLTREARSILDDVVAGMKGQPTMQVEIGGHTDALGTESYNLGLSQRRADAVRTYLSSQGIQGSRMKAEGYGESAPVADNNTEEGRAQNRRVEFKVVKQ